jgi:hypothetical protein
MEERNKAVYVYGKRYSEKCFSSRESRPRRKENTGRKVSPS